MIRLHVEDYCENCKEFDPDVGVDTIHENTDHEIVMTNIYCSHRSRCSSIYRNLRKELGENVRSNYH